jgi:hypothetical protein
VAMGIAKGKWGKDAGAEKQAVDLYQTLLEAGEPLAPGDLFRQAGLKIDEQSASVEAFYQALDASVQEGLIEVVRKDQPDGRLVQLCAVEVSTQREESEPREAVQSTAKVATPLATLWDVS